MEETQSRDPKRLQGWPFAGIINLERARNTAMWFNVILRLLLENICKSLLRAGRRFGEGGMVQEKALDNKEIATSVTL